MQCLELKEDHAVRIRRKVKVTFNRVNNLANIFSAMP